MKKTNKTIIITGAAGGIGYGLSKHMTALGWKVGMIDKKEDIHKKAKTIGSLSVMPVVCDIHQTTFERRGWIRIGRTFPA